MLAHPANLTILCGSYLLSREIGCGSLRQKFPDTSRLTGTPYRSDLTRRSKIPGKDGCHIKQLLRAIESISDRAAEAAMDSTVLACFAWLWSGRGSTEKAENLSFACEATPVGVEETEAPADGPDVEVRILTEEERIAARLGVPVPKKEPRRDWGPIFFDKFQPRFETIVESLCVFKESPPSLQQHYQFVSQVKPMVYFAAPAQAAPMRSAAGLPFPAVPKCTPLCLQAPVTRCVGPFSGSGLVVQRPFFVAPSKMR
eukprot:s3217_g4.t1